MNIQKYSEILHCIQDDKRRALPRHSQRSSTLGGSSAFPLRSLRPLRLKKQPNLREFRALRKRRKIILSLIFAVLTIATAHSAGPSPQDSTGKGGLGQLLQQAIFQEEADHNVEAAAQSYEALINRFDADRKNAATAVFRLGECYRKLGKPEEAKAQYQRIMREFGDQPDLVKLSREQLGIGTGAVEKSAETPNTATPAPQASPSASPDPAAARSKGKIYVMGQVRTQGPMDLPADETLTLSRAILRAGGFADFANQRKVRLIRKTSGSQAETTVVNVMDLLDGQGGKDPVLQNDDLIIVPERLVNF